MQSYESGAGIDNDYIESSMMVQPIMKTVKLSPRCSHLRGRRQTNDELMISAEEGSPYTRNADSYLARQDSRDTVNAAADSLSLVKQRI